MSYKYRKTVGTKHIWIMCDSTRRDTICYTQFLYDHQWFIKVMEYQPRDSLINGPEMTLHSLNRSTSYNKLFPDNVGNRNIPHTVINVSKLIFFYYQMTDDYGLYTIIFVMWSAPSEIPGTGWASLLFICDCYVANKS